MSAPVRQYSFASGELSPSLYARTDLNRYENGLRSCRNMIVMKQGGATGRPGTQYVGQTLNGGDPVRLIPFIFNETGTGQSYVLEFGDQYVAFYQNGGNVIFGGAVITGATNANPCVISSVNALTNGSIVTISGINGMTQLNNRYFIVANRTGTTFSLTDLFGNAIDSTNYYPYVSGGTAPLIIVISSPYLQADLDAINFAQSADVLTLVHPDYPIHELRRASSTSWHLIDITTILSSLASIDTPVISGFSGGGTGGQGMQYGVSAVDANGNETELQYLATYEYTGANDASPSQVIEIDWGAVAGAIYYKIYKSAYGVIFGSPQVAINTTIGFIGTSGTTTFFDSGLTPDFNNIPPYQSRFNITTGNYPSVVGFSQQRRYFAASNNNPTGFWGSKPGQYYNFDVHTVAPQEDDAISGTLLGSEVNSIQAILELKFMLMLTAGAEIYMQGNGSGVVTPTGINASVQSQYGTSDLRPLNVADVLLFNQSLGTAIRDLSFDFAIDGYRGNDITIFATHLFEGFQIEDWAYQKIPDSIVWVVRSDGVLLSCTYVREQQMLAWTRHDFDNGLVENVCAIPENGAYALYLSIKRVINGTTVRYIERLSSRIWTDTVNDPPVQNDPINASYMDSFAQYDGRNTLSKTMRLTDGVGGIPAGTYTVKWKDASNNFATTLETTPITVTPGAALSGFLIVLMGIMNTISTGGMSTVYFASIVDGKVFILNSSYEFELIFSTGLPLMGWPFEGTGRGLSFTSPDYALQNFYQGATAYQQDLILQSSEPYFTNNPSFLGKEIFLEDDEWIYSKGSRGNQVRLYIKHFTDTTHLVVNPSEAVPTAFQNTPIQTWSLAVKQLNGLGHLAGQDVSVWADRFLVGSPLNSQVHQTFTITSGLLSEASAFGTITLDKCYSVIYIGLPMTQDIESLDLEAYVGETFLAKRKRISALAVYVYNTRSFFCGSENPDTNFNNTDDDPLFELYEERDGTSQLTYDQPPPLLTDQDYVIVPSRWNKNGRIFMRNVDPVPFSLLAISPREEDPAPQNMNKRV